MILFSFGHFLAESELAMPVISPREDLGELSILARELLAGLKNRGSLLYFESLSLVS